MIDGPRVGLTLPTFRSDPESVVTAARAAEGAGFDGVFTFDHLYRIGSAGHEPALSLEPVLGALAVETVRIRFGSLVARTVLRHPAVLGSVFDTAARIAEGRFIAGLGTGDHLSDPEHEMFGLDTPSMSLRLAALDATIETLRGRGYPIWVGGRSSRILGSVAGLADGWNGWGLTPEAYRREVARLREACELAGRPFDELTLTWGGLVDTRDDHRSEAAARGNVLSGPLESIAEALLAFCEAGASWLVLAPTTPADASVPERLAEELLPLVRG